MVQVHDSSDDTDSEENMLEEAWRVEPSEKVVLDIHGGEGGVLAA